MSTPVRAIIYLMVGVTGEVIYTAVKALIRQRDLRLQGYTQIWVMPLYALGGVFVFEKLHLAMANWFILWRFAVYACMIFLFEYIAGFIAKKITGKCPWEYEGKWHVNGYIKLTHFPCWGAVGLLFELVHNYLMTLK